MKYNFVAIFALLVCCSICAGLRIVPIPKNMNQGNQTIDVSSFHSIRFNFNLESLFSSKSERFLSERMQDIKAFEKIGAEIVNARLPGLTPFSNQKRSHRKELVINVKLNSTKTAYTSYSNFAVEEAYKLNINSDFTEVDFECHGYVSFLRALETFMQVMTYGFKNTHFTFDFLPLSITDAPEFGHRGVMVDTARHFMTLESLRTTIRGLSISKLNVLHLHLTDSESFPLEMKKYPEITTYGAYSSEEVYTQNDIQELNLYAQSYGVILIPEIDSPAHTRSWSNAPGLQQIDSCRDYPKPLWEQYCNEPPCGQLDISQAKTLDVVESVMVETANMFQGEYLHLGGDEPNNLCWSSNPQVESFMSANNISNFTELQAYYRSFQADVIQKNNLNKTSIFWLASNNIGVQTDEKAIFQFWGDLDEYSFLEEIANPVILSTYTYLYLDCGYGSLIGGNSWCDPYKTWKHIYSFNVTGSGKIDRSRIVGSELALWTELSNIHDYITKIFPRAVSLSMNLWNPESTLGEVELVKHLVQANLNFELAGIPNGAVSSQYCEAHIENCFFDTTS